MPITLIILLLVLMGIALRRVVKTVIPIWAIMASGAAAVLLLGQITPSEALMAIEPDVMFYLLGVFLICQAAEESGYLEHLTDKIFSRARTGKHALFIIIFILGSSSALLMNDTIAIIGTPIILQLCKSHRHLIKPLLFALAFSITIGSTMSPIGNPQNLLIAIKGGMSAPFMDFIKVLGIPTLINLVLVYWFIYFIYRKELDEQIKKPTPTSIKDQHTVRLVRISLSLMVFLVAVKILADTFYSVLNINFSHIALLAAIPLFLSKQRGLFIKNLDWGTLIFFASTFVLMQSVWNSGFMQAQISHFNLPVTQISTIILISIIASQFISNVPLVVLYLPLLMHTDHSYSHFLALAVGGTIAGNLTILGAASNIIIIQNSERRHVKGFGFLEFIKIGAPLTLLNVLVYTYFF